MEYFFETTDTIIDGVGFDHYSLLHIIWLLVFITFTFGLCSKYRKSNFQERGRLRKIIAGLIIADELFKMIGLTIGGNYTFDYLPLHLCSINILIIAWHSFGPSKLIDNFLYLVCIPGALAALLFPSWHSLP